MNLGMGVIDVINVAIVNGIVYEFICEVYDFSF